MTKSKPWWGKKIVTQITTACLTVYMPFAACCCIFGHSSGHGDSESSQGPRRLSHHRERNISVGQLHPELCGSGGEWSSAWFPVPYEGMLPVNQVPCLTKPFKAYHPEKSMDNAFAVRVPFCFFETVFHFAGDFLQGFNLYYVLRVSCGQKV